MARVQRKLYPTANPNGIKLAIRVCCTCRSENRLIILFSTVSKKLKSPLRAAVMSKFSPCRSCAMIISRTCECVETNTHEEVKILERSRKAEASYGSKIVCSRIVWRGLYLSRQPNLTTLSSKGQYKIHWADISCMHPSKHE